MNIPLTTKHQDKVLKALNKGGSILSVYNSSSSIWENELTFINDDICVIRNVTLRRLSALNLINKTFNDPAFGYVRWRITSLGKEYINENHP